MTSAQLQEILNIVKQLQEILNTVKTILQKPNYDWLLSGLSAAIFAVFFQLLISIRRERSRIKTSVVDHKNSSCYFCWDKSDGFVPGNRICIFVRIANLSFLPNSIVEISLQLKNGEKLYSFVRNLPDNELSLINYSFLNNSQQKETLLVKERILMPIIDLEPYKTVEGVILFPHKVGELNGKVKGKLIIITTRQKIVKKVLIEPYQINE
jgi:hypothetical protein